MVALLFLTAVCACIAIAIAGRAVHTSRVLRRALEDMALKTGEDVPMVGLRWFPRFGLKSLLVTTTLLAVAVGLVGKELVRAREQDKILTDFELGNLGGGEFYVEAEYSMGIFGTGTLARLLTDHFHPSFGCEVSSLSLVSDNYDDRLYCEPLYPSTARTERLGQLRQLEALQIVGLRLSDELVESIARLKKLRHLSLYCCDLPPDTMRRWSQSLSLESLELRKCRLQDNHLEGLKQMVGLRSLVFTDNLITDAGLIHIGALPNLRTLDVSRNNITVAGLDCLFTLDRLEHLRLLGIPLTETDLAAIVPLPRLREVSLNSVKSRQNRQAIDELFRDRQEVEITWPSDDEISTWNLYDNRPGQTTGDGFGMGSGVLPLSGGGN